MSLKKRGLGRGLDALLGGGGLHAVTSPVPAAPDDGVRRLPLDKIRRSRYQPRAEIRPESLEDLASSIRAQGVVQPIVVRPLKEKSGEGWSEKSAEEPDNGVFELIAGERRWRAAQMAGLDDIPAVVREVPDQAALAIALIENIQREDLNPLEEAGALQRLLHEFGLTHQEVADAVGRSRAAVSNLLRLLELPGEVKRLLESGDLEMGHARALLGLKESGQQIEVARKVAAQGLSVRETEDMVRRMQALSPEARAEKSIDPDIRRLQDDLSQRLGANVTFQHGAQGRGRLVIRYNSLEELDGILQHIK